MPKHAIQCPFITSTRNKRRSAQLCAGCTVRDVTELEPRPLMSCIACPRVRQDAEQLDEAVRSRAIHIAAHQQPLSATLVSAKALSAVSSLGDSSLGDSRLGDSRLGDSSLRDSRLCDSSPSRHDSSPSRHDSSLSRHDSRRQQSLATRQHSTADDSDSTRQQTTADDSTRQQSLLARLAATCGSRHSCPSPSCPCLVVLVCPAASCHNRQSLSACAAAAAAARPRLLPGLLPRRLWLRLPVCCGGLSQGRSRLLRLTVTARGQPSVAASRRHRGSLLLLRLLRRLRLRLLPRLGLRLRLCCGGFSPGRSRLLWLTVTAHGRRCALAGWAVPPRAAGSSGRAGLRAAGKAAARASPGGRCGKAGQALQAASAAAAAAAAAAEPEQAAQGGAGRLRAAPCARASDAASAAGGRRGRERRASKVRVPCRELGVPSRTRAR